MISVRLSGMGQMSSHSGVGERAQYDAKACEHGHGTNFMLASARCDLFYWMLRSVTLRALAICIILLIVRCLV